MILGTSTAAACAAAAAALVWAGQIRFWQSGGPDGGPRRGASQTYRASYARTGVTWSCARAAHARIGSRMAFNFCASSYRMKTLKEKIFKAPDDKKPFFTRWNGRSLHDIIVEPDAKQLCDWVCKIEPPPPWLADLKNLLIDQTKYEEARLTSHNASMADNGCTPGHLEVKDYPTVAMQQTHCQGHREWKMTCTQHSVSCFALRPKWRRRPGKEEAGREDPFILLQKDGILTTPGIGATPYDGRLVVAGTMQVSEIRRDIVNDFNKQGELILAVRAPNRHEINTDGSSAFVCFKIEEDKGEKKQHGTKRKLS